MSEMSPADVPQRLVDAANRAAQARVTEQQAKDYINVYDAMRYALAAVLPLHEQALRAELDRARAELSARLAAESADAAAGSYAGRAEAAEAEVERLRGALVPPSDAVAQPGRITGRELIRRIITHPTWLDLPVHLLAMNDEAEWLNEVDYDCYEPDEGFVLALLAHEDSCPRATDSKARCGCVLAAKATRELRAERDAATARAEQAEAALGEERQQCNAVRTEFSEQRTRANIAEAQAAALRGQRDAAKAALAELRERLGKPTVQRGLRYGKLDPLPIPDDQVAFYLDQGHVGLVERDVWHGGWRKVDATPRTDLERAAEEQGVQPVRCGAECSEGHTYEPGSCEAAMDPDEVIAQNHRDAMRDWGLIDEPGDAG